MMRRAGFLPCLAAAAALLLPLAGAAKPPHDKAGGKALEKRSEKAAERANSQWQDEATRAQERAEAVRNEAAGASDEAKAAAKQARDAEKQAAREAKDAEKQARDAEKRASMAAKLDEREKKPSPRARGFWSRWFGGGDDEAVE